MLVSLKLITGETVVHNVKTDVVTIGRSKTCTIVAAYEGISRNHCQIEFINNDIFVTDLGSTNGVYVDGTKIEPNIKTPYQTYLTLSMGSIQSVTIDFDDKTGVQSTDQKQSTLNTTSSFSDSNSSAQHNSKINTSNYTSTIKLENKTKALGQKDTSKNQSSIKIPVKSKETKNSSLGNLIAVILLIAAIAWYATKEDEVENVESINTSPPKKSNDTEKNFEQF